MPDAPPPVGDAAGAGARPAAVTGDRGGQRCLCCGSAGTGAAGSDGSAGGFGIEHGWERRQRQAASGSARAGATAAEAASGSARAGATAAQVSVATARARRAASARSSARAFPAAATATAVAITMCRPCHRIRALLVALLHHRVTEFEARRKLYRTAGATCLARRARVASRSDPTAPSGRRRVQEVRDLEGLQRRFRGPRAPRGGSGPGDAKPPHWPAGGELPAQALAIAARLSPHGHRR